MIAIQAYASRDLGNALAAQFGQWNHQSAARGYHTDVYKIIHLADPVGGVTGRSLTDIEGFYSAIGEAINGTGGNFGWNADALLDCGTGRRGASGRSGSAAAGTTFVRPFRTG